MGLSDRLRSYFEHRRIEQRYLNRSKRTAFVSNAQYIDGEYVYNEPPSPTPAFSDSISHPLPEPTPAAVIPEERPRPGYFTTQSSPAASFPKRDARALESDHLPPRRHMMNRMSSSPAMVRDWENELHGLGRASTEQQKQGRRMSMLDEGVASDRFEVRTEISAGLPPRPQRRGSWLGRRRSVLGRS
jgi:hypothetical protein